jgi:uncharacterized protein YcnI
VTRTSSIRLTVAIGLAAGATQTRLAAQISLVPGSVTPAAWERLGLRVVNQADTPIVAVRLTLPGGIQLLGVEAMPGWTATRRAASDTAPQQLQWSGGRIERGTFVEFVVLGRVAPDARPGEQLVFPVEITRADGTTRAWVRGGEGAPPTVSISSLARISPKGSVAFAAAALGIAVLALGLTLARWRDGKRR